jgi:hypothetical protein
MLILYNFIHRQTDCLTVDDCVIYKHVDLQAASFQTIECDKLTMRNAQIAAIGRVMRILRRGIELRNVYQNIL